MSRPTTIYTWTYEIGKKKRLFDVLMTISGIGRKTASLLCASIGISTNTPTGLVPDNQLALLQRILIDKYATQTEHNLLSRNFIKLQIQNGSYRGVRHVAGLPVRGQKTRSNARTQRKSGLLRRVGTLNK